VGAASAAQRRAELRRVDLTEEEVLQVKNALGIGEEEPDECGGTRKRKNPYPDRILPSVTDRALEADKYWAERPPARLPRSVPERL
jgi:hypothetical protein